MSTTYTNAIATIADILNRTDVNTQIGVAINTALRKVEQKVTLNYMFARSGAVVLADGAYSIAYPTRLKEFKSFRVFDGTDFVGDCEAVDETIAWGSYPDNIKDTGQPSLISLRHDTSTLLIRPTADQVYNLWYTFYAFSAPLETITNETHWLLSNFEEILIYGALIEMMPLIKDFERDVFWRGRFGEVMKDLKRQEKVSATTMSDPFIKGAYGTS